MKELKNKEIIFGLAVLIVLCILALVLIIRRENRDDMAKGNPVIVEEIPIENEEVTVAVEEEVQKPLQASVTDEISNLGIKDEPPVEKTEEIQADVSKGEVISSKQVGLGSEFHTEPQYREYRGDEMWQLEEIYYYWMEYKLDAVNDLIRLPRVRTLTNELKGSNDFYYYGQKDSKGNPSGSGIAVYADNTYYCGDWKDGKRHGKGMLLKIFPDKTGIVNGIQGVTEHSYNGTWANDYPNGEGQEHLSYDYSIADGDCIITNVIGNFKDGYYNGDLYIMTYDAKEESIDWEAKATRGVFEYCSKTYSAMGRLQVWERMKEVEDDNDNFYWIFPDENRNFGIYGLKMKE